MRDEALSPYAGLFPEFERDEGINGLIAQGIPSFIVSVFDHWMGGDEAADSEIMFYALARSSGKLDEYNVGEKRFLKLYQTLSSGGVICNYPSPMRKFDSYNQVLEKVIKNSLREKHRFDMYFIAYEVRVFGGFDRTDIFLPKDQGKIQNIYHAVEEAGLHVLN
ncbi:hypothetical protein [Phyllobacterium endophyticum]|uniref:Uncharacterized protein n=1 Tax=Phyllobacterium endophyticum TaxID=1149773 RepID=A0A2P7B219_9HYPH|nr:hypothetical protein [Phyllobacterium endophyticum]MBB3238112.1 hypothetical protein [Phyllobacterium endophyticum]PSH60519.1 hypothetical protein CU100_07560 [Phyllobacterium endophyticum]TYR42696.1 hypothetical protein FY050_16090 [Phyllobacterium endophyticum]